MIARAFVCLALIGLPAAARTQQPAAPDATLQITGSVASPLTLTARDLRAMPRTAVTIKADGRDAKYEGVLVGAILARAGATLGHDMTGANVASYVVATGS